MTGPYRIGYSRHWTNNGVLIRSIGSLLIITVNAGNNRFARDCKYNSRWWVPGTEGVNSLDQYWGSPEVNWAVPPPRLIPSVLEKFQNDNAVGTVVIPEWPSATFYPILISEGLRKRIKDTFVLPRYNSISKGLGNNGIFVKEPLSFRMIAIKIR